MTTPDPIDRQLSLARQGLTPSSQLRGRVRARFGASEAPPPAVAPRAHGSVLRDRWRALRASGNVGAVVGAGLFGLGCVVGLLGSDLVREPRAEAPSTAPAHAAEPAPLAADPPSRDLPLDPSGAAALAPPASPATGREHAVSADTPRGGTAPRATRRAVPSRAVPSRDWRGELELLERAERAIRADNVALALALLGDFDARYPQSRLVEERAAVETMAHCQAHATDGAARAARFLNFYPSSLYRTRVEAACPPPTPAAASRSDKKLGAGH